VEYPYEFFELNYRYARRAAQVSGCALEDALLKYTHLYLAFGLGRSFDPTEPAWVEFLEGLKTETDPKAWIYATYRHSLALRLRPPEMTFGCFSYAAWEGGRIRLHFHNPQPGESPLSRLAIPERMQELRQMFTYIQEHVPEAQTVVGGSWLYNLEAYCRLFPAQFIQSARTVEPDPQFIAQWGQFLDHHGAVKPNLARKFLDCLEQQQDLEGVLRCFPYPFIRVEASITFFFPFYGILAGGIS